jgi:acyl carrier protein
MERVAQVRKLVSEVLSAKGDRAEFGDEDSFVLSGRLASIDILDLVVALEKQFGFDFAAEGFDANNFDSVAAIVRMLDASASKGVPTAAPGRDGPTPDQVQESRKRDPSARRAESPPGFRPSRSPRTSDGP